MPEVRNKAVRKKAVKKRRTGSKKDTHKLNMLRTLYFLVYNDERDLSPLSIELFHVIGEILEGRPPSKLNLHQIDRDELVRELSVYD